MLIDARHREETRVAVVKGNRIEEFDFESAERKQLKGNIYLAKVTRVEPSLQAAFIDYGGNRHGFLAFSEIHPDYYQIPKEDREALLREEAEHAAEEAALRAELDGDDDLEEDAHEPGEDEIERLDDDGAPDEEIAADGESQGRRPRRRNASDDQVEALRERRMNLRRRYKIQDVIKRRQVLLVQVVKEERGNKGAALTTYLSLAGRYCVLMPNTSHGGGISRKISNAGDRKRLKSIMADLQLPASMGCIVRTAGLQRTKVEIKRDFDYLARLWDGIREETLKSAAPALVYGDSDLMKRAIRDIYNKDIDEVIVEGDDGYRQAKEFMKLLMPSHARRVKHYSDPVPLFQRAGVEDQLSAMYNPVVQLKSGGYLVINPTEALVSIDINSGRSTREHNIEQTATATNLEAAAEIARQLRLRDMAGLVVIDFIDMDNNSNVRKVEKAMKEAMKNDRARIQVGRISSFGLMEMSRQRLRTGVLEASTRPCPHCEGSGFVRTASSAGLSALRMIEDEAARGRGSLITLRASQEAAFYVLNKKRADIAEIEDRYGVQVAILSDGEPEGSRMTVEASGPPPAYAPKFEALVEEPEDDDYVEEVDEEEEDAEDGEDEDRAERGPRPERSADDSDGEGGRKRRRRRRGRRGRGPRDDEAGEAGADGAAQDGEAAGDSDESEDDAVEHAPVGEDGEPRRPRRRGRGRRGRRGEGNADTIALNEEADAGDSGPVVAVHANPDVPVVVDADAEDVDAAPKRSRRRPRARLAEEVAAPVAAPIEADVAVEAEAPAAKPKRSRKKAAPAVETEAEATPVAEESAAPAPTDEPPTDPAPKPKRSRKKTEPAAEAPAPVDAPVPANDADAAVATAENGGLDENGEPRRGWWQRTFGA
ncbi:MAG: Rne/Rng family ribonuclease [Pseudomonadota bacterium]